MRLLLVLLLKELRSYFVSPIAYVVLALVMVLNGFFFRAALSILEQAPSEGSIVTWSFNTQWFWLAYFFIFPLLTMRLFAEEAKLGTLETLLTAPIHVWQVVAAKFSAALLFYLLLWVPSYGNFFFIEWLTAARVDVPRGPLMGSYTLLIFMGAFNLAIGCFASSVTANQIIAAILAFTLSLIHFLVGVLVQVGRNIPARFADLVQHISSQEHIRSFTGGLIDTRPIVYYTSLTLFFLTLTYWVIQSRRWRA
jgi:ABC-2 type transport system permease protein